MSSLLESSSEVLTLTTVDEVDEVGGVGELLNDVDEAIEVSWWRVFADVGFSAGVMLDIFSLSDRRADLFLISRVVSF